MNPNKYDQESLPWSYPAREGLTYKEMASEMMESGAIPMGVFRHPHLESGARLPYGESEREQHISCIMQQLQPSYTRFMFTFIGTFGDMFLTLSL